MPQNLTGVPAVFGDLNLAGQNMNQLNDQEQMQRKKKLLAAGMNNDFQSATEFLFGNRYSQSGSLGS